MIGYNSFLLHLVSWLWGKMGFDNRFSPLKASLQLHILTQPFTLNITDLKT